MEKNSERIEAELELPEEIIQHIQSFLHGNEAAQTSVLSRSWYQAWFTRPNLDFDQEHFSNKSDHDFWKLVTNTMERYENLNIKIDSLRLWINKEHSLVNELIIKALKSGATCLDFKIHDFIESDFTFPNQVFGFENLTRLSVSCCRIVEEDNGSLIIRCSRLKCLTLKLVDLQDNIIWDIISSCTLLEDFSLSRVSNRQFLPEFFEKQYLKSLSLSGVVVRPSFFDHFSCKFPRLKDLTLYDCDGYRDVRISSPSLERVSFRSNCYNIRRVKLDVPRIKEFTFMGQNIPRLSFEKTNTSNWCSHIQIERESAPSATWFRKLSKLLKKLRSSKVVLHLCMWSETPSAGKLRGLCDKPEVSYVSVTGPYVAFPEFYSSLFKYCRPSCIRHNWFSMYDKKWGELDDGSEFVWKKSVQQACIDSCIAYQRMNECDLRKAQVSFCAESVNNEWRTRFVDITSTTSIGDAVVQRGIFFHFEWGH